MLRLCKNEIIYNIENMGWLNFGGNDATGAKDLRGSNAKDNSKYAKMYYVKDDSKDESGEESAGYRPQFSVRDTTAK